MIHMRRDDSPTLAELFMIFLRLGLNFTARVRWPSGASRSG